MEFMYSYDVPTKQMVRESLIKTEDSLIPKLVSERHFLIPMKRARVGGERGHLEKVSHSLSILICKNGGHCHFMSGWWHMVNKCK